MSKKTTARDYSLLKSDTVVQAVFDETVKTNLDKQKYNKDDPSESFTNMCKAISAAAKIVDIRTKYLIMDRFNFNSIAYSFLD